MSLSSDSASVSTSSALAKHRYNQVMTYCIPSRWRLAPNFGVLAVVLCCFVWCCCAVVMRWGVFLCCHMPCDADQILRSHDERERKISINVSQFSVV